MTLSACLLHGIGNMIQVLLQHRKEQGVLVGEVLIQRADRDSRPLSNTGCGQLIRAYREQNLNGGFGNRVDGDRRPRLDRPFSYFQRGSRFCTHNANCKPERSFIFLTKGVSMHDKPVALVTGANKGIGLQIAKDLAARGFTVLVGSRNLEHGETAATSVGADARALQLDVTDQASIAAAAKRIRNELGRLDVLVNNAGVSHAGKPGRPLQEIAKSGRPSVASLDEVRAVFETNVFGIIAVTQAMLPLLREAPAARIVNVSSSGGSLT